MYEVRECALWLMLPIIFSLMEALCVPWSIRFNALNRVRHYQLLRTKCFCVTFNLEILGYSFSRISITATIHWGKDLQFWKLRFTYLLWHIHTGIDWKMSKQFCIQFPTVLFSCSANNNVCMEFPNVCVLLFVCFL